MTGKRVSCWTRITNFLVMPDKHDKSRNLPDPDIFAFHRTPTESKIPSSCRSYSGGVARVNGYCFNKEVHVLDEWLLVMVDSHPLFSKLVSDLVLDEYLQNAYAVTNA